MTHTTITQLPGHLVHPDPIDDAVALLVDSALAARLVCDGSCNGVASCTVAPIDVLVPAA